MDEPQYNTDDEWCDDCAKETKHHVRLTLETESEEYGGNQPYRIKECQVCGYVCKNRIGEGD